MILNHGFAPMAIVFMHVVLGQFSHAFHNILTSFNAWVVILNSLRASCWLFGFAVDLFHRIFLQKAGLNQKDNYVIFIGGINCRINKCW